jgi:hypothetical protein
VVKNSPEGQSWNLAAFVSAIQPVLLERPAIRRLYVFQVRSYRFVANQRRAGEASAEIKAVFRFQVPCSVDAFVRSGVLTARGAVVGLEARDPALGRFRPYRLEGEPDL